MSPIIQSLLTAVGASGIMALIFNSIVNRQMNKAYAKQDKQEKLRNENQFLMMSRIDSLADMTNLMAKKLHDAGIINGDLEELNQKYKNINEKYNDHMRDLANEYLKRR